MPRGCKPRVFVAINQVCGFGIVVVPDMRVRCTMRRPNGVRGARLRCEFQSCGAMYEAALTEILPNKAGRLMVQSCGCYHRFLARTEHGPAMWAINTKHGYTHHAHYKRWDGMMSRCYDPGHGGYKYYGARGISVCESWHDPKQFCDWLDANLGKCPPRHTLDRIDNDGDYCPGNVRYADHYMQATNRTDSFTFEEVSDIRTLLSLGVHQAEVARIMGNVDPARISLIALGQSYSMLQTHCQLT